MWPFPSLIMTLKFGDDQIKFTHDRHPPYIPWEMYRSNFSFSSFLYFIMGKGVGWRSWVNFIWSSPNFTVIICDGNGHISPATKTRFGFYHNFSHHSVESRSTRLKMVYWPQIWPLPTSVTEIMVKSESRLCRGRNVSISITDKKPEIWCTTRLKKKAAPYFGLMKKK